MKYLLIALLLFPSITFAQQPKPPKKASVIVIQSSLDSATIALTEAGYIVITGAGKSIYTEPKALPPGSVKLFAVQKDSLIYLRG